MPDTLESPPVRKRGGYCKPVDESLRNECKALFIAGVNPKDIEAQNGVSSGTINVWASRYGWRSTRSGVQVHVRRTVSSAIVAGLEAESQSVRGKLSQTLVATSTKLAARKPDVSPKGASVLKQTAETASLVYGWNKDNNSVSVSVMLLESAQASNQVVDVQSAPVDMETVKSDAA